MVVLAFAILVTIACLLIFFISGNGILGAAFGVLFVVTLLYGLDFYMRFRQFKADMWMFFPKAVTPNINQSSDGITEELEEIALNNEELPLKVCRFYSKGQSFSEISEKLSLNHPENAKRLLVRGLNTLLKANGEKT